MADKKEKQVLLDKVMERIHVGELIDCVADEVTVRLMASMATTHIVDRIYESRKEELQAQVTEEIIKLCNGTPEKEIDMQTTIKQKKRKAEHSGSAPAV